MFGQLGGNESFNREVAVEVDYLTKLHGEDALRVAREKAARPNIRSARRKVLEAAVRRLETPDRPPPKRFLGLFGG